MVQWMRTHKGLTSVLCVITAAALVGTAFLVAGRLLAPNTQEAGFSTYAGISESETVSVTLPDGTAATQYAGTRDPYLWPFASDSVWNMPIGSNATLTTAYAFKDGIIKNRTGKTVTDNRYSVDIERIALTTTADPEYMVIRSNAPLTSRAVIKNYLANGGTFTYNSKTYDLFSSTGINNTYNRGSSYWPRNLVVNDGGNEIAAIVQPDRRTVAQFQSNRKSSDTDEGTSLAPYDGTYDASVPDSQRFLISNLALVDLYGDGIYGSHWGSALSAMGGSVREGEITGDAQIHHALKINIDQFQLFYGIVTQAALDEYNPGGDNGHYAKGDVLAGYVWPATKCDSMETQTYVGQNPFVTMGSLLTLSEADYQALLSQISDLDEGAQAVAKKFMYALRYYGCYIVDNTAYRTNDSNKTNPTTLFSTYAWSVDEAEVDAVEEKYNVVLKGYNSQSATVGTYVKENAQKQPTKDYCKAMDLVMQKLRVVTNNEKGTVGGGGTPSKPLAPSITALEGISVANQTIPIGANVTLDVVCTPTNATVQSVTYASSNPSVVAVTNDGKTIKGLATGSATVTVTSDESGFTASCTVTVGRGDVNGDGKVDANDYACLQSALRDDDVPTAAEEKKRYDINADGDVDDDDLDALKALLTKGGASE